MIAKTPPPPYYAVIFTSVKTGDVHDYSEVSRRMDELVVGQDGFLGQETMPGVSVSYWRDLASLKQWKEHPEHLDAQEKGRQRWYESYSVRVAKVERAYHFERKD